MCAAYFLCTNQSILFSFCATCFFSVCFSSFVIKPTWATWDYVINLYTHLLWILLKKKAKNLQKRTWMGWEKKRWSDSMCVCVFVYVKMNRYIQYCLRGDAGVVSRCHFIAYPSSSRIKFYLRLLLLLLYLEQNSVAVVICVWVCAAYRYYCCWTLSYWCCCCCCCFCYLYWCDEDVNYEKEKLSQILPLLFVFVVNEQTTTQWHAFVKSENKVRKKVTLK